MQKTILTLFLFAAVAQAHSQGTIAFGNSALTRVTAIYVGVVPTTLALNFGVFWGTNPESVSDTPVLPLGHSSTTTAGIIVAPSVYAIPGTEPLQTVFLQIRGWDASFGTDWRAARDSGSWFGQTDVRQVTLGPTAGPGALIWQGATGTDLNRFYPMYLPVPEPSAMAFGAALSGLLVLLRRLQAAATNRN
jgi:hypothetical protein